MFNNFYHRLKNHPSRGLRVSVGVLLIIGGTLGWLPILGFWMIPLGILLLSVDFHWARRLRRRFEVWNGRRKQKKQMRQCKPPKSLNQD